jgi:hypothetical protein
LPNTDVNTSSADSVLNIGTSSSSDSAVLNDIAAGTGALLTDSAVLSNTDTSHTTDSARPTVPAAAPDWFKLGFGEVTKVELGPTFDKILWRFIEIESIGEFADLKKGFPSSGRPNKLGKWIGAGQWRRSPPIVTDVERFAKTWWKWWVGLQPDWRKGRETGKLGEGMYGDDWDSMTVPGPNGWLSVVACLYWWGCATRGSLGTLSHGYEEALQDVIFMMDGLLANLRESV